MRATLLMWVIHFIFSMKNEPAPLFATLSQGHAPHSPDSGSGVRLTCIAARAAKVCRLGSLDLGRYFSLHDRLVHLHSPPNKRFSIQ